MLLIMPRQERDFEPTPPFIKAEHQFSRDLLFSGLKAAVSHGFIARATLPVDSSAMPARV
jgi:hypothetical protein